MKSRETQEEEDDPGGGLKKGRIGQTQLETPLQRSAHESRNDIRKKDD
jgi:hypothetical protein